jgi:signal transduction histidine kinase
MARSVREVIMALVEDPWQARLNRMRRLLPLPMLALSAAITFAVPVSAFHRWARFELGLPLTAAAAVLWAVASLRLGGDPSTRWRLPVFAAHTVLAAALVWIDPAFGVFAYIGFLYSYGLGDRWRIIAELAEANRRLAASMEENSQLQAQLMVQAREAGVTEERQRMACEIHDTLAQGLTGIIAQLEAADHTRGDDGELSRHLGQAAALARSSLTEARRSVRALRPGQLEQASLPEALGELARGWSEQTGVTARLDTTGTPVRAGADVEAALFRVTQEALSNVAKHAQAGRVQLTLSYTGDMLLLDVADDGNGGASLNGGASPNGGYGLAGMEQRLARIGGTLTIESAPGSGTTVNAAVPLTGYRPGDPQERAQRESPMREHR